MSAGSPWRFSTGTRFIGMRNLLRRRSLSAWRLSLRGVDLDREASLQDVPHAPRMLSRSVTARRGHGPGGCFPGRVEFG
jgi:hypothetical protein